MHVLSILPKSQRLRPLNRPASMLRPRRGAVGAEVSGGGGEPSLGAFRFGAFGVLGASPGSAARGGFPTGALGSVAGAVGALGLFSKGDVSSGRGGNVGTLGLVLGLIGSVAGAVPPSSGPRL